MTLWWKDRLHSVDTRFCHASHSLTPCTVSVLVEMRSVAIPLKEDELAADNLIHVAAEPSESEVSLSLKSVMDRSL